MIVTMMKATQKYGLIFLYKLTILIINTKLGPKIQFTKPRVILFQASKVQSGISSNTRQTLQISPNSKHISNNLLKTTTLGFAESLIASSCSLFPTSNNFKSIQTCNNSVRKVPHKTKKKIFFFLFNFPSSQTPAGKQHRLYLKSLFFNMV